MPEELCGEVLAVLCTVWQTPAPTGATANTPRNYGVKPPGRGAEAASVSKDSICVCLRHPQSDCQATQGWCPHPCWGSDKPGQLLRGTSSFLGLHTAHSDLPHHPDGLMPCCSFPKLYSGWRRPTSRPRSSLLGTTTSPSTRPSTPSTARTSTTSPLSRQKLAWTCSPQAHPSPTWITAQPLSCWIRTLP